MSHAENSNGEMRYINAETIAEMQRDLERSEEITEEAWQHIETVAEQFGSFLDAQRIRDMADRAVKAAIKAAAKYNAERTPDAFVAVVIADVTAAGFQQLQTRLTKKTIETAQQAREAEDN